jgi:ABC-type transport system involved in multi-copper enzyme maturation permease subunit
VPEGVTAYPRWQGELRGGPAFLTIALEDARRALRNTWSQMALVLVFAYAVIFLGGLGTLADARGDAAAHTWTNFQFFLGNLRWGALAVAAVMAGPALLEDARRGALELYLARGIPHRDYVAGKVLAVFGMSFLAFAGPAVLYVVGSHLLFEAQPQGWEMAIPGALAYGILLGLVVTGLGLGLSSVARSSRGATLLLFGGVAILDIFVGNLLEGITRNAQFQVLSPLAALAQQSEWMFGQPGPHAFPAWWGLAHLLVLLLVGWGLLWWKQPRLAGEVR